MARNTRDIRFASFNLHNLQLPGAPMYAQSQPYPDEEFAAKAEWAAAMLRALDADVIAFQELWSAAALEAVMTAARLAAAHAQGRADFAWEPAGA